MPDTLETDSHPIRADWAKFKNTAGYKGHRSLHSEDALFEGFRDGWMYGRTREPVSASVKGQEGVNPVQVDWVRFKKTPEFKTHMLLHSEAGVFEGFRGGWFYGRMRQLLSPPVSE